MKTRIPKAPKFPKRTHMQELRDHLSELFSYIEDEPNIKRVEEKDGLFTAYNEGGRPVAYFSRAFAEAIQEYAKVVPYGTPKGCESESPNTKDAVLEFYRPSPFGPSENVRHLVFVVARGVAQFTQYGKDRRSRESDARFIYVNSYSHLLKLCKFATNLWVVRFLPEWDTFRTREEKDSFLDWQLRHFCKRSARSSSASST